MALSTNLISGLSSGFDWRSMIDELMKIERRPIDLMTNRKTELQSKLSEWQTFNSKLLALKSAAAALKDPESFSLYSTTLSSSNSEVSASRLLSVSATESASLGSYSVVISNLATAQKLSSNAFSSASSPLGDDYAGDIVINGRAIAVSASDTLKSLRDKINDANSGSNATGVTAAIVSYAGGDHRLILTSDTTGVAGIGLQNGSAANLTELFGWKDGDATLKNPITGGARSDLFSGSTQSIQSLLGLSAPQSGTVRISGEDISIDLATDSLESIKNKINAAGIEGVFASVVPETSGGATRYRLQIDGGQSLSDDQNILETLGFLKAGVSDVRGTVSANAMTANGSAIAPSTLLTDIDGYTTFTSGDTITLSGQDHNGNAVHSVFSITAHATVQDLMDELTSAFGAGGSPVAAGITANGKIQVADLATGAGSLSVSLTSDIQDPNSVLDWGAFSALSVVRKRELVQGQDATVALDGVSLTSSDNTVEDVLAGLTLTLLSADPTTTITLAVNRDVDGIMERIRAFVSAYNDVSAYIKKQQSYDEETQKTGGVLFGDGTLSSIKGDLVSALLQTVSGVSSSYATLGLVGVSVDKTGQLSIQDATLRGYLRTNFSDVGRLFSVTGAASVGTLQYVGLTRDTQAGSYAVNISQAATRSTAVSDTAVSGTLGASETLFITERSKTAAIALSADMTLSDMVNAINTELSTVYTETLAAANALYADAAQTQVVTGQTAWSSVYDESGVSSGIQNGDVIAFEGTKRTGGVVSGTYTIQDAASDTLQGLLSAIEAAYGNTVTASIDASGRITITDKSGGESDLAITFNTEKAHDLDFGSVSASNPRGREGRYAMDLTASADEDDHLVLTHNSYGSAYGFILSETADLLWTGGDQNISNGLDVAGTIHGEAATGAGQILTGAEGAANVDGLAVRYTGTATGRVGDVALTLGVSELFDRVLFNITDTYEGYVAFKLESLQNSIDGFQARIEENETRLDRKMETMINRFVAMEKAIAAVQSQSQWLSAQINTLYRQWS
jgi:flagellar hook-associated protein 2